MTTEITNILNGFKQFSENPYEDSIKFLRDYIEVEPSKEAFFELGKALFFNEEYDESIEYLKKSKLLKANAYLGLAYFKKEDFKKAIRHFNLFLKEKHNETILTYLMLSYENDLDWENALKCGEELIDINPSNHLIKLRLIDCHLNLRQYQESIDCIDELLDYKKLRYIRDFDDNGLKYKKGLALFKLKRYEEAIEELRNLKTLKANHLIIESYEKLKKPSKAIRYLLKAYEQDPNDEILFEISKIAFENQNHRRSIHYLERILMTDPKNERALEKIAENYLELQKFELVITYCEELLKVNEDNFNAYLYLSETYQYLGNHEKAIECIENGLSINPKSSELWVQKAWVYYPFDEEIFKNALKRAIKLAPNNTKNYTDLIGELLWEDETAAARKYYEKLLFYNPAFTISFDELVEDTKNLKESCYM